MTFNQYTQTLGKKALLCTSLKAYDKMAYAVLRAASDDVDIEIDDFFDLKYAVACMRAELIEHFARLSK